MTAADAAGRAGQAMPSDGRDDVYPVVVDAFAAGIRERRLKGIQTYGRELQTWNGRNAGLDAWEELLDLAQYVTQMRIERADLERQNAALVAACESIVQAFDHNGPGGECDCDGDCDVAVRMIAGAEQQARAALEAARATGAGGSGQLPLDKSRDLQLGSFDA